MIWLMFRCSLILNTKFYFDRLLADSLFFGFSCLTILENNIAPPLIIVLKINIPVAFFYSIVFILGTEVIIKMFWPLIGELLYLHGLLNCNEINKYFTDERNCLVSWFQKRTSCLNYFY